MLFNSNGTAGVAAKSKLEAKPGTLWRYSSGTSNLLSEVLRRSFPSDEEYWAFPRRALFDPLGMVSAIAQMDAAGTFIMSSYVYASVEDWGRFGALFARDGRTLEGTQLLPQGWAAWSGTPAPASPTKEYGAHWWIPPPMNVSLTARPPSMQLRPSERLAKEPGAMYASGYAGQFVFVLPSHDLVLVRTGLHTASREPSEDWDLTAFVEGALDAISVN